MRISQSASETDRQRKIENAPSVLYSSTHLNYSTISSLTQINTHIHTYTLSTDLAVVRRVRNVEIGHGAAFHAVFNPERAAVH